MSKIVIGKAGARNVSIDIPLMLTTRLLVQANSGGGKSWLLRRLAEQLFGKVQTIIIDPEGEFFTLRDKFGYVLVGEGGETPADVRSAALLAQKFMELKISAVCDLYEAFRSRPTERRQWVRLFLNALLEAPRSQWRPLVVIVDESHKFCPQETPKAGSQQEREIIAGCKDAMIALATTGRKRGFCAVWATQRLAKLDKDASAELFNRLVGMTIEDVDVDRAADLMSVSKVDRQPFRVQLRTLHPGQFFAFGRAIAKERVLFMSGPIHTRHPESGAAAKHSEPPPMPDAVAKLLPKLADLPKEAETKARTEAEFRREIRELKQQLTAAAKSRTPSAAAPPAKVDPERIKREIERAVTAATAPLAKQLTATKQRVQAVVGKAVGELIRIGNTLQSGLQEIAKIEVPKISAPASLPSMPAPARTAPSPVVRIPVATMPSKHDLDTPQGMRRPLSDLHRKIAGILAGYYPEPINKTLLASFCGKTVGGGWNGRLSEVNSAGLLEYVNGNSVRATEECLKQYGGTWTQPSTLEEAIAVWDFKLSERHRLMLNRLIEADGDPVPKAELAEVAGMTMGGGFNGRLSELCSTGLALYVDKKFVKANKQALFLEAPDRRIAQ